MSTALLMFPLPTSYPFAGEGGIPTSPAEGEVRASAAAGRALLRELARPQRAFAPWKYTPSAWGGEAPPTAQEAAASWEQEVDSRYRAILNQRYPALWAAMSEVNEARLVDREEWGDSSQMQLERAEARLRVLQENCSEEEADGFWALLAAWEEEKADAPDVRRVEENRWRWSPRSGAGDVEIQFLPGECRVSWSRKRPSTFVGCMLSWLLPGIIGAKLRPPAPLIPPKGFRRSQRGVG